jgi:hypothetical protein
MLYKVFGLPRKDRGGGPSLNTKDYSGRAAGAATFICNFTIIGYVDSMGKLVKLRMDRAPDDQQTADSEGKGKVGC